MTPLSASLRREPLPLAYDADLIRIEPRNTFTGEIEVGMQFEGVTAEGEDDMLYNHHRRH